MKQIFLIMMILAVSHLISEPFSFVVMGDSRPPVEEQPYVFYKVVDKIAELEPEMVFSTGDIIAGYKEDRNEVIEMYQDFEEVIEDIKDIPLYVAPGNHDVVDVDSLKNEFTDRFGQTYQAFSKENCYFIILNSDEPGQSSRIAGKQLEWLIGELKKAQSFEHVFVFVHKPLYPKIKHIGTSLDKYPVERDKLAELLLENNVDMVFCGHTHIYNHSTENGLHQIITGGAGAPLYADTPEEGGFYHVINVLIDGNDVDYRIVPIESEVQEAEDLILEGYYKKAVDYSLEAMKYLPEHPEPYFPAILGYKLLKEDFPAKIMYDKLSNIFADDYKTSRRFAYFCYDLKCYEQAEEYFLESVEIDPTSYDSFYRLGRINETIGNPERAIEFYQEALPLTQSEKRKERINEKIEILRKRM